ncbi:MAG: penicillin-binding protein 2 [Firmicutes bacterium]|nr:penicillin-binding protein 2 [Bacillota bacterium]
MKTKDRQSLRTRLLVIMGGFAVFSGIIVARLATIQVVHAGTLNQYAQSIHMHDISLPALRGDIVSANGTVLAMNVPRYQIVAAPRYVAHPRQEAQVLAHYLPFSVKTLQSVLHNDTWYALLDRSVTPRVAHQIMQKNLVGIAAVPVTQVEYPNGTLASNVIGVVGSNGQGLSGIEYQYNKQLSGKAGHWLVAMDASGNPLPEWQKAYQAPQAGDTVQLTINANIEQAAQKYLAWGIERAHALDGTVIVENPKTGAIIALANWPDFNPNNYSNVTPLQMDDFAVQDPVPPGSIWKPVTATAALTLGIFTPTSMFYTDGYKIVDGVRIDDWKPGGWGWITLTKGFEVSSDQVFMDVALKVGVKNLYHFIHLFGFDHPSGVGLPGDSSSIFIQPSKVNPVDLATMGFGQGLAVTAMQMTAADAAIINNGTMMQPHILKEITAPNGRVVEKVKPIVESHPTTVKVAQEVQHMMVMEATQGTGVPAQVPGYIIGGKTGTAQKIINGQTSSNLFVASYMGAGPFPHPRFIMLVMINRPVGKLFYGDQVSAPVWKKIATYMFHYWGIKPYAGPVNGSKPGPIPGGTSN